jgi:hypothetical protein
MSVASWWEDATQGWAKNGKAGHGIDDLGLGWFAFGEDRAITPAVAVRLPSGDLIDPIPGRIVIPRPHDEPVPSDPVMDEPVLGRLPVLLVSGGDDQAGRKSARKMYGTGIGKEGAVAGSVVVVLGRTFLAQDPVEVEGCMLAVAGVTPIPLEVVESGIDADTDIQESTGQHVGMGVYGGTGQTGLRVSLADRFGVLPHLTPGSGCVVDQEDMATGCCLLSFHPYSMTRVDDSSTPRDRQEGDMEPTSNHPARQESGPCHGDHEIDVSGEGADQPIGIGGKLGRGDIGPLIKGFGHSNR